MLEDKKQGEGAGVLGCGWGTVFNVCTWAWRVGKGGRILLGAVQVMPLWVVVCAAGLEHAKR